MNKHTKGPWELSYDKGNNRDVIASSDKSPICSVRQSWVSREQYHANAKLIAAAPDLLAALKSAVAYPITGNWCADAIAAIAKAEGDTPCA